MDVMIIVTKGCSHCKNMEKRTRLPAYFVPGMFRGRLPRSCSKIWYPAFAESGGG